MKSNEIYKLFFYNIEKDYPEQLSRYIYRELGYFAQYIRNAIQSMDTSKYGMSWAKDEDITYTIYPKVVIEINKPKNKILLKIDFNNFSTHKVLMDQNGYLVEYENAKKTKEGIILTLKVGSSLSLNSELYYGRDNVEWQPLTLNSIKKIEYLTDDEKNRYSIIKIEEGTEKYTVYLDNFIQPFTNLYINDGEMIDYNIKSISTLKGIELYDSNGIINFSIVSEDKVFKINTNRKIEGELLDNFKRSYNYELVEKKNEDGVWIVLKEIEDEVEYSEDYKRSKFDIFFEILYTSIDFEVWEEKEIDFNNKNKRIRVLKTNQEENKICLEREPAQKIIYPPKNTYMLTMQLSAINTLIYRPAPGHRNLLRLFEPVEKACWENPTNEFNFNNIKWFFLTDFELEGTDEQREFVLKALNTTDFAILEGPPGSGKTTTIAELIYQITKQNKRVLLSASTHVAVDNVIEKLEEKFKNNGGIMENGIVPLRIGREESISDDIVKYQIDKRKERVSQIFEKEDWFINLNESEKKRVVEEAVINASNLVCGTTIGILQYPNFKNIKKYGYIIPEFDYLIIDESSKTTFQEFLVPAIFAKKWIIIGDVKQLSPFTDTLYIRINLDSLLNDKAQKRALIVFLKLLFSRRDVNIEGRWFSPPKFIYVDTTDVIKNILEIIIQKIQKYKEFYGNSTIFDLEKYTYAFVIKKINNSSDCDLDDYDLDNEYLNDVDIDDYLDNEVLENDDLIDEDLEDEDFLLFEKIKRLKGNHFKIIQENQLHNKYPSLFDIDIIFVEEKIFEKNKAFFPHTHILIHPNSKNQDAHDYKHLHWYLTKGIDRYAYFIYGNKGLKVPWDIKEEVLNSIYKDWAEELAWRIKRIQEIQLSNETIPGGSSKKFYLASLYALLPEKEEYEIMSKIRKIAQISLTSVINCFMKGVTEDWKNKEIKTAISHGLPDYFKELRYIKLSYQHRMHPDISSVPRKLFYSGEALKDDGLIAKGIRYWDYKRYQGRAVWLDLYNSNVFKNTNLKEAKKILEELELFIIWAKSQNKKYSVMILSFYEAQRKKIRDLLRDKYPENRRKETTFIVDGLLIRNYTVDKAQGREADLVFISMVQNKRVGFMDSPNRLNVALTRAKFQLVIIGDFKYFNEQRSSPELREITKNIRMLRLSNDTVRSI